MRTAGSFRSGRGRRYWFLGATVVAAAVFGVFFVASSGANLPPSTFEGNDGNMTVDTAGNTDWVSLAGNPALQSLVDLPSGSNDNSFGQGTKEDDTNVTVVTGTIPPNKNDLTRSYIFNERIGSSSFLYLAWERAANTGDAHIDFELNQNATPGFDASTTGKVTLNRTVGDLLISYDFGGSGTPDITLFKWDGTKWADQQDLSALGFAEAAVNTSPLSDVLNGNASVGVGDFGEASVNLSDALVAAGFNPDTCQAFGSTTVKARASGSSTTAELKDFIAPTPIHVTNCATPTIATQTSVTTMNVGQTTTVGDKATLSGGDNPTGTVSFQLYADADCQNAVTGVSGSAPVSGGVATFAGVPFTAAQAGTYYWGVDYSGDNHNNEVKACGGANEEIVVNAADVSITKTADHTSPVSAGDPIGFTVEVKNTGLGDATGVTLSDPLPAGSGTGVTWAIDSSTGTPTKFVLGGAAGSQTLGLASSTLPAGADYTVHITAQTSASECSVYDNTATLTTGNANNPNPASAEEDCLPPGLAVFKTADAKTVDAGDPIGFKITVANGGSGTAAGVTLNDPLPAGSGSGVTWSIDSGPTGSVTPNCSISTGSPQVLTCAAVDLPPGANYELHVTAKTSYGECTQYDNTATATPTNGTGASASASITCLKPSLSVTKTADASPVNAGDPIGFTITVSNGGQGTAKNATLSDPLPAGTATPWSLVSGPPNCSISGVLGAQTLQCTAIDMASGDSYSVHVTSTTSFADCTDYDNTATAHADNAPNAQASASIVCQAPGLSVTKTADAASVKAGDAVGFTITVANAGPGTAKSATLADPLPAGTAAAWSIDPAYSGPGTCSITGAVGSQELDCSFGDLAAKAGATVHVRSSTSLAACTTYDNTATASASNAADVQASASISCKAPQIDLAVTKVGSPNPDTLPGDITWTMVVTNNGPDTATGVKISDPMPAGNTYVSAQTTQGSCTGGAVLSCSLGTMAAGAKVTITLVTRPSIPGTVTNKVTVVGNEPETNTANNTASASVVVKSNITPPTVYCVAVSKVTPKQLFVGRKALLKIHLTKHGKAVKGVRVRIKGPKFDVRTKPSNHKGVITRRVKMKKAGVLVFSPLASKRCNTKRLGVTGVFTPPVTG